MITFLIYGYIAVFLGCVIYECYNFSLAMKMLKSTQAFFFMLTHTLAEIAKHIVWPIVFPLRIIQMVFLKGTLDDYNEKMAEYLGIEDVDKGD
jgi:hypothetical protein